MELKDYQEGVLERLSAYLNVLKDKKENALILSQSRKERGLSANWGKRRF